MIDYFPVCILVDCDKKKFVFSNPSGVELVSI